MKSQNKMSSNKGFIISLVLIAIYIFFSKPWEIIYRQPTINWFYIFSTFLTSGSIYIIMAFRYWSLVRLRNPEYTLSTSIRVHFLTPILARVTPANAGELLKITHEDLDLDNSTFIHLLERFIDFLIILLFSIGITFIIDLDKIWRLFIILGLVIFIIVLVTLSLFDFNVILKLFRKEARVDRYWFYRSLKSIPLKNKFMFVIISILIYTITIVGYFLLQQSIGVRIPYLHLLFIIAATVLFYSLSGLPGGLGVREVSLFVILIEYGLAIEPTVVFTLLITAYLFGNEMIYALISRLITIFSFHHSNQGHKRVG